MAQDKVNIPAPDSSNSLPAAARGPAPCTPSGRHNGLLFPVVGNRVVQTPDGPVEESYDRVMWPSVDWTTDNLIDYKIRFYVKAERDRCAKIAESTAVIGDLEDDQEAEIARVVAKIRSGE